MSDTELIQTAILTYEAEQMFNHLTPVETGIQDSIMVNVHDMMMAWMHLVNGCHRLIHVVGQS